MASISRPIQELAKVSMGKPIRNLAMKLAYRYTSLGSPAYPYIVEPIQLAALVNEFERVSSIAGSILEIGVAWGMTTRFLCEHIVATGRTDEKVYAIDTFASFTAEDVEFEIQNRGKTRAQVSGFQYLDFEKWKRNFSEFKFLAACKSDCSTFDYASVAPIKMVFLDVDLYLPTLKALRRIYPLLALGGVVLIDDVKQPCRWDGAYQAYSEFCAEIGAVHQVIGNKMGVVRKQGRDS